MKPNDFVSVHFEDGCLIGRIVSIEDETMTISFDNAIMEGIPKDKCALWVSV